MHAYEVREATDRSALHAEMLHVELHIHKRYYP